MKTDIAKNKQYYKTAEPCDCNVCRFFCSHIRSLRPDITAYLDSMNIDIEKPLELIWIENDKTSVTFYGCQYVAFGECEKDLSVHIGDVEFVNNIDCHPSTNITDEHFVLDFGEITMDMEEQ